MKARTWDELWAEEGQQQVYGQQPDPYFTLMLPGPEPEHHPKALDLGCGLGRHTRYLGNMGYDATSIDSSPRAVEHCRRWFADRSLPSKVCRGSILDLPFRDGSFDIAVAWDVIYHGTRRDMVRSISEITRTTRKGGLLFLTLITTRHVRFGEGTEVEPNTFLDPEKEDGCHLHHYCTEDDVRSLLFDWSIEIIGEQEEIIGSKKCSGAWHWIVLARRTKGS